MTRMRYGVPNALVADTLHGTRKEKITNNIEERCREIRYAFFANILKDNSRFAAVLVAHHQDDLLETYLLQKQRNILPNYYGLKEENIIYGIKIIRPLLGYKKCELEAFCKENHIPYALDYTNFLDVFSRNKIRHHVIEKMTEEDRRKLLLEIENKNKELQLAILEANELDNLSNQEVLKLSPTIYRLYLKKLAKEVLLDFEVSKKVSDQIRKVLE